MASVGYAILSDHTIHFRMFTEVLLIQQIRWSTTGFYFRIQLSFKMDSWSRKSSSTFVPAAGVIYSAMYSCSAFMPPNLNTGNNMQFVHFFIKITSAIIYREFKMMRSWLGAECPFEIDAEVTVPLLDSVCSLLLERRHDRHGRISVLVAHLSVDLCFFLLNP